MTNRTDLTPAAVRGEVSAAIIRAIREDSLADKVSTLVSTDRKSLTFPIITDDVEAYDVAESAQIQLDELETSEITVEPTKVVAATKLSVEAFEDSFRDGNDSALSIFTASLYAGLNKKIDRNLIAALTASTNIAGSTDFTSVDAILEAATAIEIGGGRATSVLVSPAVALELKTAKRVAGGRDYLLADNVSAEANLVISGIEVIVSRYASDSELIVTAKPSIVTVMRSEAGMVIDESALRLSQEVLMVVTARLKSAVLNPSSVQKITVA